MWAPAILKGLEKLQIRSGFPCHVETPSFYYWLLKGGGENTVSGFPLFLKILKLFLFFTNLRCFSQNPSKKSGWICWLRRCVTLIDIIATSAKTNILSRSVLKQVTHVSFVNIWFGLYGDTQLRCISRIRNVQFTMPPIFLTICLTTRHRVFFRNTGALQLFDIFEVFLNTHLRFFF